MALENWEAGKVSTLCMDLNLGLILEVEKKMKKKLLIDYLYFFCEFLALLNVTGNRITIFG